MPFAFKTVRFHRKLNIKDFEFDTTPMIDVVFLLIVFFTLVINFTAADQNERIKLPISELSQPPEQMPTTPVTLHILTNGDIIYDGTDLSLPKLRESLRNHLSFLGFLNIPAVDVTVIIRADARCEVGKVFDVEELCRELGVVNFVFRTKQQPK